MKNRGKGRDLLPIPKVSSNIIHCQSSGDLYLAKNVSRKLEKNTFYDTREKTSKYKVTKYSFFATVQKSRICDLQNRELLCKLFHFLTFHVSFNRATCLSNLSPYGWPSTTIKCFFGDDGHCLPLIEC